MQGGAHGSLAMGQPRPAGRRLLPTVVTTQSQAPIPCPTWLWAPHDSRTQPGPSLTQQAAQPRPMALAMLEAETRDGFTGPLTTAPAALQWEKQSRSLASSRERYWGWQSRAASHHRASGTGARAQQGLYSKGCTAGEGGPREVERSAGTRRWLGECGGVMGGGTLVGGWGDG